MKDNLLFIHIPKTGGQSILKKLKENQLDNWKRVLPLNHDPLFIIERNNKISEKTFKFTVVRNPYTRTFSYYKHFCNCNKLNLTFTEFLIILKEKNKFYPNTPFIVYPQSFFIYNKNGEYGLNKIYRYEKFNEIENDLNFKFECLNKGFYEKNEYFECMSNVNNVNLIQELFSVDFFNFNYEMNLI